jgi:protein-arginine kinase
VTQKFRIPLIVPVLRSFPSGYLSAGIAETDQLNIIQFILFSELEKQLPSGFTVCPMYQQNQNDRHRLGAHMAYVPVLLENRPVEDIVVSPSLCSTLPR